MLRLAILLSLPAVACAGDAFTSKLKVEAAGGVGGEGPVWHPTLGVLTSGNGHANRFSLDGKSTIHWKDAGTNGLLFDREGRLIACGSSTRRVTRTDLDGKVTVLADAFEGKKFNTPNDLTIDSKGRIYFSDPRYGDRSTMEQKHEGVYRIDPDGKVSRIIADEVERANGVLVSADDKFLFVADNNNNVKGGARKLYRFDLKADGTIDAKSRKLMYDWKDGRGPDGLKQDTLGRLYVAAGSTATNEFEPAKDQPAGVYVIDGDGKLVDFVAVPTDEVTNCAFGGEDRKTLYITAGGVLYSIRTSTPGRVVYPAK